MEDLRLVQLREKQTLAFGIKEVVGTLVAGSVLMMVGLYAYSKVSASIDQSGFTAAENTTIGNIRTNVTSGFDLASIIFIVLAAGAIIGILYMIFK